MSQFVHTPDDLHVLGKHASNSSDLPAFSSTTCKSRDPISNVAHVPVQADQYCSVAGGTCFDARADNAVALVHDLLDAIEHEKPHMVHVVDWALHDEWRDSYSHTVVLDRKPCSSEASWGHTCPVLAQWVAD